MSSADPIITNSNPFSSSVIVEEMSSSEESSSSQLIDLRASWAAARVFNSNLFWAAVTVSSLIAAAFVIEPFAVVAITVAALIAGIIKRKELKYEVTILPTIVYHVLFPKQYPWFQPVIDDDTGKLILGAIPLKNWNHHKDIINAGISYVLTLLERFEWETKSLLSEPMRPVDWSGLNVFHLEVEAADFLAVSQDDINRSIEFIRQMIKKGVYVHCKAGRGRSATAVICYLLKYGKDHGLVFNNADEAIAYVISKRAVVHMNPQQKQAIYTFWDGLHNVKVGQPV